MNKNIEIAFGFIIVILVVVGFIISGISTLPTDTEIAKARTVQDQDITMPQDVSQMGILNDIAGLQRNGNLPVQLNETELGRPNPFLPI